jgi:hypothetical protein
MQSVATQTEPLTKSTKERRREYYLLNIDHILEEKARYREENREDIKNRDAEYRDKNREKINTKKQEKVECECGCVVARNHLSEHKKSKNHIKYIDRIQSKK